MVDETCGGCRFWGLLKSGKTINCVQSGVVTIGHCRRKPPALSDAIIRDESKEMEIDEKTILLATRFPITMGHEWCGRFKANSVHALALVREYRVDRESHALSDAAGRVVEAEAGAEFDPGAARRALTALDERLVKEIPDMIRDIRERARSLATSNAARALIDWAPLDNALAECLGEAKA